MVNKNVSNDRTNGSVGILVALATEIGWHKRLTTFGAYVAIEPKVRPNLTCMLVF